MPRLHLRRIIGTGKKEPARTYLQRYRSASSEHGTGSLVPGIVIKPSKDGKAWNRC